MSNISETPTQLVARLEHYQGQQAAESLSPNMEKSAISHSETRFSLDELSKGASSEGDSEALAQVVEELNQQYQQKNIALNFSIDDETDTLVVKVIDQGTDKVIRQVPPDAMLALKKNIQSMLGAIFDQEA